MAVRWLKLKQTGASVASSKVETFEAACSRLKNKLEEQLGYWNNQQAGDETGAKSARSLWFKKKDMGDQWLVKMQIGTTPVYTSVAAKENNQPWIQNIDESEMANAIKMFIKGIEDKDPVFDKHLKETYNLYELNQKTSLLKSKATRDAKKAESES